MTDQQTSVLVSLSDSLPDVLNRLGKSTGSTVSLVIPAASSLFLTASEFRALQAAADRARIAVTVTTDDPLRQQLAALFKLPIAAPELDNDPASTNGNTPNAEQSPSPTQPPATESTSNAADETGTAEESLPLLPNVESDTPTSPHAPTSAYSTDGTEPDPRGDLFAESPPVAPGRLSVVSDRVRATTKHQRLIAAGSLAAALVVTYLAAFLFLTSVTVVLTLRRQAISRDLTVAVAAPGISAPAADLTIAATPVTFAVSSTQTMNATGSKTVGDAAAHGKVSLSNPTTKNVTVEAGTQLEDKITGTKYAIANTVELPAGKNGAPGFGEAEVTCLQPGTIGNRDQGLLSGRLPNGVYYANREAPIAGGTDKQIAVVAQADLDALQAQATTDMEARAAAHSPGPELVVLAPSIQLSQPSFTPDHQVDQESTTVTLQATAQVTALAYLPTELRDRVADALGATSPDGYEIDRSSLQLSEPSASGGNAQATLLALHADASARAILTPENRSQIAETIAGDDEAAAKTYLTTLPGVENYAIRYSPSWLPNRIPSSADRVHVETR
ncbi:MAG: hypothetical protein QOF01_5294 [Thermomicrobiales bacterium]|nr:hypothetical protein [Thermomicrobiales bacterium]